MRNFLLIDFSRFSSFVKMSLNPNFKFKKHSSLKKIKRVDKIKILIGTIKYYLSLIVGEENCFFSIKTVFCTVFTSSWSLKCALLSNTYPDGSSFLLLCIISVLCDMIHSKCLLYQLFFPPWKCNMLSCSQMRVIFDQGDNQFDNVCKVLPEFWCFHQKTAVPIQLSWNDCKAIVFASKAWLVPFKTIFALRKTNMLWKKNGSL